MKIQPPKGLVEKNAEEAVRNVLAYRLYFDLRRGWRFNNPNLEQLRLLPIDYEGLEDLGHDQAECNNLPCPELKDVSPENRYRALKTVLDTMRRGLCIKSRYLDPIQQERFIAVFTCVRDKTSRFQPPSNGFIKFVSNTNESRYKSQSYQYLKEPWAFTEEEYLQSACSLLLDSKPKR